MRLVIRKKVVLVWRRAVETVELTKADQEAEDNGNNLYTAIKMWKETSHVNGGFFNNEFLCPGKLSRQVRAKSL